MISAGEARGAGRRPGETAERFPGYSDIGDAAALPDAPVASIIVATYRHEDVLEQCIDSLAKQETDFPFEILIAEDCSPDGTRDVALALQRKYPHRVRVIFTPQNKGGTLNSIFATSLCRGDYIGSCDGDDFWVDNGKLARQVAALRRFPEVDMAFSRGYRLYPDGVRQLEWDYGEEARIVDARELFSGFGWTAPTASLLFRAHILRSLPPWFEEAPFGDVIIVMGGSARGGAYYDPAPTICYRIAYAAGFTATLEGADLARRERFLEQAIHFSARACRHYGVPMRAIAHRVDDYRLALAKLRLRDRRPLQALKAVAAVRPAFLLAGAWRSAARRLRRPGGA